MPRSLLFETCLSLSPPRHICPIATYMIGVAPSLSPGIGNGGKSEMSGFMPRAERGWEKRLRLGLGKNYLSDP